MKKSKASKKKKGPSPPDSDNSFVDLLNFETAHKEVVKQAELTRQADGPQKSKMKKPIMKQPNFNKGDPLSNITRQDVMDDEERVPFEIPKKALRPAKPIQTLTRKDLFDDFASPSVYPILKLSEKILQANPAMDHRLEWTGVEQLTDLTFAKLYDDLKGKAVTVSSVDLSGCRNITDQGIYWMIQAFPQLTKVSVNGCKQLTSRSLAYLAEHGKQLQVVHARATGICVVPRKACSMNLVLLGCPLVSSSIPTDAEKFKPVKTFRACIMRVETDQPSIVSYLSNKSMSPSSPAQFSYAEVKLADASICHVTECPESACTWPMFLTKRTVYVLPYTSTVAKNEPKDIAWILSKLIVHITSKCNQPVFLIVGMNSGADKVASPLSVNSALGSHLKPILIRLKKQLEVLQNKKELEGLTYQSQRQLQGARRLLENLEQMHTRTATLEINLAATTDQGKLLSNLQELRDKELASTCTEYAQVSEDVLTTVDTLTKHLTNGLSTTEAAFKSMKAGKLPKNVAPMKLMKGVLEVAHTLGSITIVPTVSCTQFVAKSDWLMRLLNAVSSCSPANSDSTTSASTGAIPLTTLDKLKADTKSSGINIHDPMCLALLQELGLVLKRADHFLLSLSIPLQTTPPLDYFWENKKSESDLEVIYTYTFPSLASDSLIQCIQRPIINHYPSAIRSIWSTGILLQEALVDVLIDKHDHGNAGNSSLRVAARTLNPTGATLKAVRTRALEQLWHSVEQWKLIIDATLLTLDLTATVKCEADSTKPGNIVSIVTGHIMEYGAGKPRCQKCHIPSNAAKYLWTMARTLYPTFLETKMFKHHSTSPALEVCGTILKALQSGEGETTARTALNPYQDDQLNVTLLDAVQSYSGTLSLSNKNSGVSVSYDMSSGKIKASLNENSKPKTTSAPGLQPGDTVSFKASKAMPTAQAPNQNMLLSVLVNEEQVYSMGMSIPPGMWIFKHEQKSGQQSASMYVDIPLSLGGSKSETSASPGMRLEALDKLNPSLICAASITQVSEEGKYLIHFDGWTDRYDYWAEPTDPALHPLGYMEFIGHTLPNRNLKLQKPHGYPKSFDWATYLQEIEALPAPYEIFTEEQTVGTPPDEELRVLELLDGTSVQGSCSLLSNRPLVLERKVYALLADEGALEKLWKLCSGLTKFPCLLPAQFDRMKLNNPARRLVTTPSLQRVHFLCSGQAIECLHFVDCGGEEADLSMEDLQSLANVLRFVLIVLTNQESFLPSKALTLCAGTEEYSAEQCEEKLSKVLLQYLLLCELLSPWKNNPSKADPDSVALVKVINKLYRCALSKPSSTLAKQFPGASNSDNSLLRCMGHSAALAGNQELSDLPLEKFDGISKLVYKLDFQRNRLSVIPPAFVEKFAFLYHLNFSGNQITECPDTLFALKYLEWLDISSNKIMAVPDSLEKLADTLTYLNISSNPLVRFPDVVLKLFMLEQLHADNIGEISSLQGIAKLTELKVLSLCGNLLVQKLHEDLGKLKLTELYFSGLPWLTGHDSPKSILSFEAFADFLNKNMVLQKLDKQKLFGQVDKGGKGHLIYTEIADLNNNLFNMYPRFGDKTKEPTKSLKCSEGGLPEVILSLKSLTKLELSYHSLRAIPRGIGQALPSLTSLRLSDNPVLETLPGDVGGLPLKELHLKGCSQLKTPPKEVINRGFGAVFGYLKRLEMGSVKCRRTKLMVVGLGGAGKTSLIQALTHRRFYNHYDEDDLYEMMGEAITDGIDITTWKVHVGKDGKAADQESDQQSDETLEYSVWDFAGQTVYYNTHQFFLSTRAVYLLLWNIRLGYEHAGLDFWLSSIACHAPGAPVLVVGTHCDKVEKPKLPTEDLERRYPLIKGFHTVSSYSLQGIPNLQNNLIELTLREKYMGEQIPAAWLTLEGSIKKKCESNLELLPWKEVEAVGHECGIIDQVELSQAVEFLHDLGSVQFFNTDFLRSYVVINPQWIVNVMTCVVSVHEGAIKDGKFVHSDMALVWQEYPVELHSWLLRLTEEFDLTFGLHHEEANLVPCLLPDKQPKYDWPDVDRTKGHKETKMIYRFMYLPAGLFNRVQVRLHQFSDNAVIWKKGSLLKKNNHLALILQNGSSEMLIKVQGPRPENILMIVHEVVECLIADSFYGVQYDFSVPCSDCLEMNTMDPCMFNASKVQRAVELNAQFLQCDKYFHILSISELQANMPADQSTDFDLQLGRSVRELQDLHDDLGVKVYFSYSRKNVPQFVGDSKMVHPKDIENDMRKAGMKVTATEHGDNDDLTKLTMSLKQSDIVMVGMSDAYVEDKTCRDLVHFARETLRKTVILVILGSGMEWRKSKIGLLCGQDVYVNFQRMQEYNSRITELIQALKQRTDKTKAKEYPSCFVSYCWSNSRRAVQSGTEEKPGTLGWGDPREVKDFLAKNGVSCWMDFEQVGKGGLYEDIAEGLRHAKVMVACVSDQYAVSKNCQMEFRYAVTVLKIPTILAVMGTGYDWEGLEIGMLSLGYKCPKVHFQYENASAHLDLLGHVQAHLPKEEKDKQGEQPSQQTEQQVAFQEVLELAQRKFLRHVVSYADAMDSTPYPRLIVLDIAPPPPDKFTPKTAEKTGESTWTQADKDKYCKEHGIDLCKMTSEEIEKLAKSLQEEAVAEEEKTIETSKYCFTLMCECEEAWHDVYPSIPIPVMSMTEEESFVSGTAAYMARILSILKHASLSMTCLTSPDGERLHTHLDQLCVKTNPEFQEEYTKIRRFVMELDKDNVMAGLKKCQLPNGKAAWLCVKHQPVNSHVKESSTAAFMEDSLATRVSNTEDTCNQKPIQPQDEESAIKELVHKETSPQINEDVTKDAHQRSPLRVLHKGAHQVKQNKATSRACSVM